MYKVWTYITNPIWNNEFHYNERIALWSKGEIWVPSLKQWTVADLEEGSEIVFEEVENGKLKSCTGLRYFIQTEYKWIPTYIFDNHNHALTFRYQHHLSNWAIGHLNIIHIDQHADTKPNNAKFIVQNPEWIEDFVNEKTNVGNFITAAINNWIIDKVIQIRTDYALHHFDISTVQQPNIIVDIDVDFREQKSPQEMESDFEIIRNLVDNICLITIATSPYFMDQQKAIELVKNLLS